MSEKTTADAAEAIDAVVVGAGWAGLFMLHRLRDLGLSVRVFETGSGVGGTWYWNRYPGARCDIPSLNYSFSFSPELWQRWNWSERYAAQPEIERYANFVADTFDLRRDITFDTRVDSCVFDEDADRWTVTTDGGEKLRSRFVFMATGGYSTPIKPAIEGIDDFEGEIFYTARWPREQVDFTNRRIGVIGTGSSGMQAITTIGHGGGYEHLYVFQRTPNYALPAGNHPLDEKYLDEFKKTYPEFWHQVQTSTSGTLCEVPTGPILALPDEEFAQLMDHLWTLGGPAILNGISDLVTDAAANERVGDYLRDRVRERVDDPAVAELLCAKTHYIGARRHLNEDQYFEVYNRPDVTLVDVHSAPIARLTAHTLETSDTSYELDTLILATGFDSGTGSLLRIDIRGRDGLSLQEKWADGPQTFLGVMTEGFPNLFVIAGPGSPSIRSNLLVSIEQHVEWMTALLRHLDERGADTVETTREAEASWTRHVADTVNATLIAKNDTQYVGANVPGKPRVYLAYVGGVNVYKIICAEIVERDYEGFRFTAAGTPVESGKPEWSGPPTGPGLTTRFGTALGSPVI